MSNSSHNSIDQMSYPSKRRRLDGEDHNDASSTASSLGESTHEEETARPISPPQLRRHGQPSQRAPAVNEEPQSRSAAHIVQSPIQLTHIADLPAASNIEAVRLDDLLGHPLIKECWQFNYLFDIDFVMSKFDADIRSLVNVKIVNGFWKKEERLPLDVAASAYPNVEVVTAYMPEPFGTHHCKMMILFRHDDTAQVIIHTANMIVRDWRNMCQAVWRSPLLPLDESWIDYSEGSNASIGSGQRFKFDLLTYISAYGPSRTGSLVRNLQRFDFAQVKAALMASVPKKQPVETRGKGEDEQALWGWQGLRRILQNVPTTKPAHDCDDKSSIVVQVSSIATLGQTDGWLKAFLNVLGTESSSPKDAKKSGGDVDYHIIFPTPDEIRKSLDGYASGRSIHTKTQSAAQQKQLSYLRPLLRHWTTSKDQADEKQAEKRFGAGRSRAAPHIKTYIRFTSSKMDRVDWAMVTSANLSTQAWGALPNKEGVVRICSWEIGVVVWPALFSQGSDKTKAIMVPTFQTDAPGVSLSTDSSVAGASAKIDTVIGLRMPYDLPLKPYHATEEPWVASASYTEPDWKGNVW